ncbi:leucine-rich repeat protein [uncultured Ruminococcus sp.]|uniref:leucine-rich repeat protein n=1 Tax=uncultured Ruminococcus sp. TaxID=165186 RepID=UPI0025DEA0F0|nr:leucine-rich repeat protein [uncultured Ruminococcus sp.]
MKKTKIVAAALSLIVSGGLMNYVQVLSGDTSITAIAATPENYSDGKFNFSLYSDHAVITGSAGKMEELSGVLKIPASAKGAPVTEIGQKAFENAQSISSVSIPDSVNTIGMSAFQNCSITTLTIPDSVRKLDQDCFCECSELQKVTLGKGITSIPEEAFAYCNKLKEIEFKGDIENFGKSAFECCGFETFKIPDSVKKIGSYAFSRCFELVSVDMGSGLEAIDTGAFVGCMKLKNIKFSPKLKGVDNSAFDCCISLEEVKLPASVKYISWFAFRRCESLKSITIPNIDCTIEDHEALGGFTEQTVVCGAAGSYAQEYAKKYGYQFKIISTPSFGDLNGDGAINAVDASEILSIYTRIATNKTKPTSNELTYYDVNKDGAVNAVDASYVLSFYAYNSTSKTKISFTDYMKNT